MTKANWKEAPHDAETYEEINGERRFCKPGKYWSFVEWRNKSKPENWTILEHRPRIIAWEDMKEGMVVRCLHNKGYYNYKDGKCYPVGVDEYGDLGPLDDDGHASPSHFMDRYTFELVSEPEQRKTVKDAVDGDWVNHNGKETLSPSRPIVGYDPEDDLFFSCEQGYFSPTGGRWEYQVCTREEFEAEVKRLDPNSWDVLIDSPEGEDEEWTHMYGGDSCYIKVAKPDLYGHIVIVTQTDGYVSVCLDDVEPIKPTITKEQFELLEKARQYFDIDPKDFAKFMNVYEVK